jgi:hypothetical protein
MLDILTMTKIPLNPPLPKGERKAKPFRGISKNIHG